MIVHVGPTGRLTMVYRDDLAGLLAEGTATVRRASHVEPNPAGSGWVVDLGPSSGPVLGPYALRARALTAELGWVEGRLGEPHGCPEQ